MSPGPVQLSLPFIAYSIIYNILPYVSQLLLMRHYLRRSKRPHQTNYHAMWAASWMSLSLRTLVVIVILVQVLEEGELALAERDPCQAKSD